MAASSKMGLANVEVEWLQLLRGLNRVFVLMLVFFRASALPSARSSQLRSLTAFGVTRGTIPLQQEPGTGLAKNGVRRSLVESVSALDFRDGTRAEYRHS